MSSNKKLLKKLFELRDEAVITWRLMRNSREVMWKHVVEIYFFYKKEIQNEETLRDVLKEADIQFKGRIKSGINFGALLRLIWGTDNCDDNEINRHAKAINVINEEYSAHEQLYKKDGVAKLVNWIKKKGGINGLAGKVVVGKKKKNSLIENQISEEEKLRSLLSSSIDYIDQLPAASPFKSKEIDGQLKTSRDDLGVLLVRRTNNGMDIVAASKNKEIIDMLRIEAYQKSLSGLPLVLRCLLETVKTQCLPKHLQGKQDGLVELNDFSKGKNSPRAHRRLIFSADKQQFIYSATNKKSGVVTIAAPIAHDFDQSSEDIFLTYRSLRKLETEVISNYEHRFYSLIPPHKPANREDEGRHAYIMRLQSTLRPLTKFMYLDFWPCVNKGYARDQQIYAVLPENDRKFDHHISKQWFVSVDVNFIDKWLERSGNHLKRKEQEVCCLVFSDKGVCFKFNKEEGVFVLVRDMPFPNLLDNQKNVAAFFKTKDIVPAIKAISEIEIDGDVHVVITDELLFLSYGTEAAKFLVAVPRTSEAGTRFHKDLLPYEPNLFVSFEEKYGIIYGNEEYEE